MHLNQYYIECDFKFAAGSVDLPINIPGVLCVFFPDLISSHLCKKCDMTLQFITDRQVKAVS